VKILLREFDVFFFEEENGFSCFVLDFGNKKKNSISLPLKRNKFFFFPESKTT